MEITYKEMTEALGWEYISESDRSINYKEKGSSYWISFPMLKMIYNKTFPDGHQK